MQSADRHRYIAIRLHHHRILRSQNPMLIKTTLRLHILHTHLTPFSSLSS